MKRRSKVIQSGGYRWESVPVKRYKDEGDHFREITRQTLLGEGDGEEPLQSITRYFEIQPGGFSSKERHQHPHSVIVIRGRGQVLLDDQTHPIGPFDCVFVAPGTVHQFRATAGEPLGFLCIVDRERDRPERVD